MKMITAFRCLASLIQPGAWEQAETLCAQPVVECSIVVNAARRGRSAVRRSDQKQNAVWYQNRRPVRRNPPARIGGRFRRRGQPAQAATISSRPRRVVHWLTGPPSRLERSSHAAGLCQIR